jgi:hypothetical protein
MTQLTPQAIIDTHAYAHIPTYKAKLCIAISSLDIGNHPTNYRPSTARGFEECFECAFMLGYILLYRPAGDDFIILRAAPFHTVYR